MRISSHPEAQQGAAPEHLLSCEDAGDAGCEPLLGLHLQGILDTGTSTKPREQKAGDQPVPSVLHTLTAAWLGSSVPGCGKHSPSSLPLQSCKERDFSPPAA